MNKERSFRPYTILMRINLVVLLIISLYLGYKLYVEYKLPLSIVQSANAETLDAATCQGAGLCGNACCPKQCTGFGLFFCRLTCDHFGIKKDKECKCISNEYKCTTILPVVTPIPYVAPSPTQTLYLPIVVKAEPTQVVVEPIKVEPEPQTFVVVPPQTKIVPKVQQTSLPVQVYTAPIATAAPIITQCPFLGCGNWGCSEDGRSGEAADQACEGWGPNTASTNIECKEAAVDPISNLKGLCIVVEKNYCPGQVATSADACSCMDYGTVSCGLYGCADHGRSGEAADKACAGWGPDTANTKYECKEGKMDPITHKKGLCAIVAKNYCPGKPDDKVLTCDCLL